MISMLRLLCFGVLFAVLCATGGKLCLTADTTFFPGIFGDTAQRRDMGPPEPLRSRAETFRGVSPVPDITTRMFSSLLPERRAEDSGQSLR